jgi:hypothetical protein
MEGIAKTLATMLLGTTVQFDESAYFDTSCYAIVYSPEPHVVLEGTCRAKPFDSAWETAPSFILPLGPRDYEPDSPSGAHFFFLIQRRVLGQTFWSADWNDHPLKTEATTSLGDDFRLVIGEETSHLEDDVCWLNDRAKICFQLPISHSP